MDVSGRRRAGVRSSVVAGSVWESRMKSDEVKGGIRVFNGDHQESGSKNNNEENVGGGGNGDDNVSKRVVMKREKGGKLLAVSGKRKTWKSDSSIEGGQIIQIAKQEKKNNNNNNNKDNNLDVDEQCCKELSVSVDKKINSPVLNKKGRLDDNKEMGPIQSRKMRSEVVKALPVESCSNSSSNGNGKEVVFVVDRPVQLRKSKSESIGGNGVGQKKKGPVAQLRKAKSETECDKDFDGSVKARDESNEGNGEFPDESDCKELDVCQEKVTSSEVTNLGGVLNPEPEPEPEKLANDADSVAAAAADDDDDDGVIDDADDDEEFDDEQEEEEEEEELEEVEVEKKEINVVQEQKPQNIVVNEVKKFNQFHDKSAPFTSTVNKQPPPVIKRATIYSNLSKPTTSKAIIKIWYHLAIH